MPKPRTFYCSEIAYCPRQLYYKRLIPKEYPPETLKIFMLGDMIHDKLSEILGFKYKEIESEGRITLYMPIEDIRFGGRFDDLVRHEDQEILIEKKSCASLYYIEAANKPHHHHLVQLMLYIKALGLNKGYIIYIEKNTLKTKTFEVEYDAKLLFEAIARASLVQECLDTNTLPDKKPLGSWQCKFCPHKKECDKNENPKRGGKIDV